MENTTEMESTTEASKPSDKLEDIKQKFFEKLEHMGPEPVVEVQPHHCDTSVVVWESSRKQRILCYCESEDDAQLISKAVSMAGKIMARVMVEKLFS